MNKKDYFLEQFGVRGILKDGHFRLTSGKHSSGYMQCAGIFTDPQFAAEAVRALVDSVDVAVDVVISPAVGGVLMGYETARQLGLPNIFAERQDGTMTLRRGFELRPGQRVLVVEDVITTGGSVKEVLALVEEQGAEAVAVAVIVDRSGGRADFGVPVHSLVEVSLPAYEPDTCPLCHQGIPIDSPGSRNLINS